jgi:hypothetical protein
VSKSGFSFVYMGMKTRQQTDQLKELRARTDRDLAQWINLRLDEGLQSRGARAEEIYLEVAPVLVVANLKAAERVRLEVKLERLAESFEIACSAVSV